jgi:hypothetical protein
MAVTESEEVTTASIVARPKESGVTEAAVVPENEKVVIGEIQPVLDTSGVSEAVAVDETEVTIVGISKLSKHRSGH